LARSLVAVRPASFTMAAFNVIVGLNPFVLLAAIAAVITLIINFHTEFSITDENGRNESSRSGRLALRRENYGNSKDDWRCDQRFNYGLFNWLHVKAVDDIIDRWYKFIEFKSKF
jgi:hypothetical protein